uniref:hypothetical protein n=1 Tax=Nocardia abscessus TaxID=120957 RepID=UPI00189463EF|nr:hypothetical protein [Nocardia abscessus]MBF6340051.1 hypothetical protein [Nocardia abscessus]
MADKTTAPTVVETAVRLLLAEAHGATGAPRIAGAERTAPPARSYPGSRRRDRKGVEPIRGTSGYRAKPQRPLRIPGRG